MKLTFLIVLLCLIAVASASPRRHRGGYGGSFPPGAQGNVGATATATANADANADGHGPANASATANANANAGPEPEPEIPAAPEAEVPL